MLNALDLRSDGGKTERMQMVSNHHHPGTPADARSQPRSSMFLAAVMRAGGERTPAKVRNMSQNGAMIESSVTPSVGTIVDVVRGALVARGTVIWSSENRCGVRFSSDVSVKDWLSAPTQVQQQRVDDIVALVKAGGASLILEDDAANGPRSPEQLVDDIGAVVLLLQDLEDDLAGSDATLERHGVKLQSLDIAVQMLRAVTHELTLDGSEGSVSLARLRDLRVACAKAIGTATS